MSAHTPVPWAAEGPDMFGDYNIVRDDGVEALAIGAVVSNLRPADEVAANAAFIVRAVNSHAALVAALRETVQAIDAWRNGGTFPDFEIWESNVRAALAQSEAE